MYNRYSFVWLHTRRYNLNEIILIDFGTTGTILGIIYIHSVYLENSDA